MRFEFDFSFLNCQSCSAKIHCEECRDNLEERLKKTPGIDHIAIDIQNKCLSVESVSMDEDDLLDALEEVSIFAD